MVLEYLNYLHRRDFKVYVVFCILCFLCSVQVTAQHVSKTRILVLATPHLEQLPGFEGEGIQPVLNAINRHSFQAVAVEQMPAELLKDIERRPDPQWQILFKQFGQGIAFGRKAQHDLKIPEEQAYRNIKALNSIYPLRDSVRQAYILNYLCLYDMWSALLHYQQLKSEAQLPISINHFLKNNIGSLNEINQIALHVARQNNLRKVEYIDDLQDETILSIDFSAFFSEYAAIADSIGQWMQGTSFAKSMEEKEKQGVKEKNLLPLYTFLNSPSYMKEDVEHQWQLWLNTHFASGTDRSRYMLWEMRNLKIAANILKTASYYPGQNILVLIGASHKSFIEKFLTQIPEIELISFR